MRSLGKVNLDCAKLTAPGSESDPRLVPLRAQRFANIGKYREAVDVLTPAIERDPNNVELLLARARYRERAGYWAGRWGEADNQKQYLDGARQDFDTMRKVAEANPAYKAIVSLWWSFLGPSLVKMNDEQRKYYYEQAVALSPSNPGAMVGLSDLVAGSEPDTAIDLLKRSIPWDPSGLNYYKLAVLQNKTGNHSEALKSINLAISLETNNATYYEERDRIESELGVTEIERKRHLAEGYSTVGDIQSRHDENTNAYQSFRNALKALEPIAKSDASGAVAIDVAVIKTKIARVLEASRERVSGRILNIKPGEGAVRQVIIDRGADDGVRAGDDGALWSIYSEKDDKERKVQKLGTAKVLSVGPDSATVEIKMDDPTGDKLAREGDMVEVNSRVPPVNPRSILWRLGKFHMSFTNQDGQHVFVDFRKLYSDETPEFVDAVMDEMATEVKQTAAKITNVEVMNTVIKKGRFKGKTLRQVLEHATRDDVKQMLEYLGQYPATFYGQDLRVARTFAVWVLVEPE